MSAMDYEGIARRHIQDAEYHAARSLSSESADFSVACSTMASAHAQIALAAATMWGATNNNKTTEDKHA